jgi:CIC family chloride channel protein
MKMLRSGKTYILSKIKNNENRQERLYLYLTLITGAIAGLVAVTLNKITHYLTLLLQTDRAFTLYSFFWGLVLIYISGYLTTRYFKSTSGSGVPDVRVSLAVFHGRLKLKDTIAKFFTTILTLASGFSLGLEGPTVRVCSGIGSLLGEKFNLTKKRLKALVAVGAAGGIAAAFNTPIAAVVFTLEEIVGDLNAKALGPIILSSVVASVVASYFMGNHATFAKLSYELHDHRELILYLIVGVTASMIGPLWMNSVLMLKKYNLKLFRGHQLTIIVSTFLLMALLSQMNTTVLGSGHDQIVEVLLSMVTDWKVLLILFGLKFFATAICYSSGASGGLFMPTLFMGATLGGLIGAIAKIAFPGMGINIGAYALVGMGAFFVSVIRAPFTSIIIVFEMTRDYNIILPLMIANITSYFFSGKFSKGSIYEKMSENEGVHLPTRDDDELLENLLVEEAMIKDVKSLPASLSVKSAMEQVRDSEITGHPVLDNGLLVGMISTRDIGDAFMNNLSEQTLENICTKKIISIYPDQSLLVALHYLNKYHISRLPVVSRLNDHEMVGLITAENIVGLFGLHIQEESKGHLIEEFEKAYSKNHSNIKTV